MEEFATYIVERSERRLGFLLLSELESSPLWLHALCTTEDIFACFSSLRALPTAEECGSLSPLWGCNLALVRQAFIECSVVKLDYGKVSTTDLSSFDIPLWCTELQEMI